MQHGIDDLGRDCPFEGSSRDPDPQSSQVGIGVQVVDQPEGPLAAARSAGPVAMIPTRSREVASGRMPVTDSRPGLARPATPQ